MSEGIIGLETLDDIGRAIQYVEDSDDQYTPGQMAEAIERMKRTIIPGTFTSNGEYDAILDDADGYNPVIVAVPQPEGTININQNGTVDVRQYANANVQVPQPSGTVNISQNGTTDVTQYATANVQVPNTYTAADEGKVVQSDALVAQTSRTVRENGTYDTTLNNELVVAIPSAAGTQGKLGANTTVDTLPEVYGPMGTLSDDYVTPVAYGTSNAVAINTAQAYEVKVMFRLTALPSAQAAIFGRVDASHPVPAMYVAAGGGNITYAVPVPPETQGGNVIYRTGSLYDTDAPLPLGTDITVGIRYAGGSSFEAWVDNGSAVATKTDPDYTPYAGTGTVLLGYDQRQGNGIAGLSGATINTETTSITQGVNRLWGGVKGGVAANIQPLTVSQNGTYNPPAGVDGFAPVTVQVSGGGGGTAIIDGGTFQVVQNDLSGVNIAPLAYNALAANANNALILLGYYVRYDLANANTDVTVYAVIQNNQGESTYPRLISLLYSSNTGNEIMFYVLTNGNVGFSTYNSDTSTTVSSISTHVYAISVDNTTKKATFYIDGETVGSLTFNNAGNKVTFGGASNGRTARNASLYFAGCVMGLQSDASIRSNSNALMEYYHISNGQ